MRKNWWLISLLLAVMLVISGCDSGGGGSDDDGDDIDYKTPPEVIDASELPASGATSAPASDEEVIAVYSDIYDGIQTILQENGSESLKAAFNRRARATEKETTPISYEDEHMKYTGEITSTSKYPDDDWEPAVNTTYNNLVVMSSTGSITGTITEATITGENGSYLVSGETEEHFDGGMNVDVKVGTSMETTTFDIDLTVKIASGIALSFRNVDTGVGGKIIISYGFDFSEDNLTAEGMGDRSAVQEALEDSTVTITLYNDEGSVVRTVTTTLRDIPSSLSTGDSGDDEYEEY